MKKIKSANTATVTAAADETNANADWTDGWMAELLLLVGSLDGLGWVAGWTGGWVGRLVGSTVAVGSTVVGMLVCSNEVTSRSSYPTT